MTDLIELAGPAMGTIIMCSISELCKISHNRTCWRETKGYCTAFVVLVLIDVSEVSRG